MGAMVPMHSLGGIHGSTPTFIFIMFNNTLMYKNYITQEQLLILDYKNEYYK